MKRLSIALLVLAALTGCGSRQVVVDSSRIATIDRGEWVSLSEAPGAEAKGPADPTPIAGESSR